MALPTLLYACETWTVSQRPGNRLQRIEKSGVALSTKEPHNLNQREFVKLKESVKNGKQEPRINHRTRQSPNSHALFATEAYTANNYEQSGELRELLYQPNIIFHALGNAPAGQCLRTVDVSQTSLVAYQ